MGTQTYYRKVADKKSIQILTAGGVEYVDDDYSASGHSPFTFFLLNELKSNERPLLTASELATNVEKAVGNNVDQVPRSGVLQGAGDELGEFIFINVDVVVNGVPKEKVKVTVNVVAAEAEEPQKTAKDTSLRLGVRLTAANWGGKNRNSDTDFEGNGGQVGLNLLFRKKRFYTGFELQAGEYAFQEEAPDQVTGSEVDSVSDVKIGLTELDLDVGYYFWRHVSLFLTLKGMGKKWDNNDYEMNFGALGGGVAVNWPIAQQWDLFGSLAIFPLAAVNGDGQGIGDVSGGELECGAAYTIKEKHRLGVGLRLNTQTYDFDIGDKQEHRLLGLFVSYDYRFDF
jgi:hypothetical protein